MRGHLGQYVIVIPQDKLIIVRLGAMKSVRRKTTQRRLFCVDRRSLQDANTNPFVMIRAAKYRHLFWYGLGLSALLFLLRWLQWKLIIVTYAIDIYIALIACLVYRTGYLDCAQDHQPQNAGRRKAGLYLGILHHQLALEN
jgi:hypothetical protein